MNMRFYTNEQVHQIVDQLLLQFDEAAPGPEPAQIPKTLASALCGVQLQPMLAQENRVGNGEIL